MILFTNSTGILIQKEVQEDSSTLVFILRLDLY